MFPQNLPSIGKTYPPEGNSYGYIYAWKDQSQGVLGKDIVWVVRVGLQPVCKCKRVMVSKGFRTGYNKTGYSISHTMLGRQVTYNSILFISFDYYMQ